MIIPHRNEATDPCFRIPRMEPRLSAPTSEVFPSWSYSRTPTTQEDKHSFPEDCFEHDDPSLCKGAIAHMENLGWLQRYPARAAVFHHGDPANSIHIVRQGKL